MHVDCISHIPQHPCSATPSSNLQIENQVGQVKSRDPGFLSHFVLKAPLLLTFIFFLLPTNFILFFCLPPPSFPPCEHICVHVFVHMCVCVCAHPLYICVCAYAHTHTLVQDMNIGRKPWGQRKEVGQEWGTEDRGGTRTRVWHMTLCGISMPCDALHCGCWLKQQQLKERRAASKA